jgi:hypothetical protein
MNRIAIISIILLIILSPISCKTIKKEITFANKRSYSGVTESSIESKNMIDNEKAYEIYFKIEEDENCIKVSMKSKVQYESIVKDEKSVKTYFIVEKAIDISKFIKEEPQESSKTVKRDIQRTAFSEIGRNFDYRWNRKRSILICTSKEDPIKKLDKSSLYRIRFTIFMKYNFSFTITVNSDQKIIFIKKLE